MTSHLSFGCEPPARSGQAYDSLGRLTDADYSTGESYDYTYDAVGNRLTTSGPDGTHTYSYDDANRLTSVDGTTYTWDDRGNLTHDGVYTYTYNAAGRLVQAESVTSTLVYTYTAGGLRVAQSVDGEETEFAWDWASGLPEMLSEGGNLYLVGHETLGQWDGDEWAYYLSDALGSVRQVTDETGAVVNAREWTPYGVEVGGSTNAGLGYTGEWQDAALGMTYLRARWYNPRDGIFVSRDPVESEPPYQYVRGNPVNRIDPSGYIVTPGKVGEQYFYSCKCGWIDTSHAGARKELIQAVRNARSSAQEWVPVGGTYTEFGQSAITSFQATARFVVRRSGVLNDNDANEVALGIHIAWENFFESKGQGTHPIIGPVSAFSEEDLVSDLIGFHRGLKELDDGMSEEDSLKYFMKSCSVVGYEYYELDKATFKDIQQQIYWEYLAENGTFRKHYQWGCRPPGRWSGAITMDVGPQFDTERVIPPIDPTQGTCSYTFSCDKQQEQFPLELTWLTPQSPGKNWSWDVGTVSREVLKWIGPIPHVEYHLDIFHDYDLNPLPLHWAPTRQ